MNMIWHSLEKGFSEVREERIREWTELRAKGFWKPVIRESLSRLLMIVGMQACFQYYRDKEHGFPFAQSIGVMVVIFTIIIISEMLNWQRRESEWREYQQSGKVAASADRAPDAGL